MAISKKEQNVRNVKNWRTRAKQKLVDVAGGKCVSCGYDRCISALEFHHVDGSKKEFGISQLGHTQSFERAVAEIKKCVLLCANCHREVHAGMVDATQLNQTFDDQLICQYSDEIRENRERRKIMDLCGCGRSKPQNQPYCSKKCAGKARRPSKLIVSDEEIVAAYGRHHNYEKVGKLFGVTGAAVKRRLKKIT